MIDELLSLELRDLYLFALKAVFAFWLAKVTLLIIPDSIMRMAGWRRKRSYEKMDEGEGGVGVSLAAALIICGLIAWTLWG